jgi:hypothetical protein
MEVPYNQSAISANRRAAIGITTFYLPVKSNKATPKRAICKSKGKQSSKRKEMRGMWMKCLLRLADG